MQRHLAVDDVLVDSMRGRSSPRDIIDPRDTRPRLIEALSTLRGKRGGADPLIYPELLEWIGDGRITVRPFVERHALADINDVFDQAHHGKLVKRAVLIPS